MVTSLDGGVPRGLHEPTRSIVADAGVGWSCDTSSRRGQPPDRAGTSTGSPGVGRTPAASIRRYSAGTRSSI